MITDALNTFASRVSLNTGAAGNYLIGDVIPLSVARNLGTDTELYIVASMNSNATSAGAATLALELVTDDNEALASPTVIATLVPTTALAGLTAGTQLCRVRLPSSDAYETFLGIRQVTGTAAFTGGKISVTLTPTAAARRAYPDGI